MIIIPIVDKIPSFFFSIELDGEIYFLHFYWNTREKDWYMTISDADDVPILKGIKLVLNYDMLQSFRAYDVPPGVFLFERLKTGVEITEDNFASDFQLAYLTKQEVDEVIADTPGGIF